ncbi:MAG: MFS transporter [Schleiferiaceae bacterium]|nr:MFS transporter [Schleiferiaceae bacterium]
MVYSKRTQWGWAMYDWANSSYSLVIGTAIFPIYYTAVMEGASKEGFSFFGGNISTTAAYTFAVAASFLTVSLITPYLSALAEIGGSKKQFMRGFIYAGSAACMGMYFFTEEALWWGLLSPYLASLCFSGSLVFYNSYLPEIAPAEAQDALSARGFALGYLGSSMVLIAALACIQNPDWFNQEGVGWITRMSFVTVGLWWLGWGEYSLSRLPKGHKMADQVREKGWIRRAYQRVFAVLQEFRAMQGVERFLLGFFFASAGVQTIILIASLFGTKVLGLETSALITTILLIQFVGILGSWLFSKLSSWWGNLRALILAGFLWVCICALAYVVDTETQFYLLGSAVGLVLGGIQSLARSTFSKLLPSEGEHVTFFSFFDIAEKLATVLGMVAVGWMETVTGDLRLSALLLSFFFLLAVISWMGVKTAQKL